MISGRHKSTKQIQADTEDLRISVLTNKIELKINKKLTIIGDQMSAVVKLYHIFKEESGGERKVSHHVM